MAPLFLLSVVRALTVEWYDNATHRTFKAIVSARRPVQELEGLSQPVIKKTCVIAQTADHPETSSVIVCSSVAHARGAVTARCDVKTTAA